MNSIIKFESHELEIIDRGGGRWLTASDLAKALDYKSDRSVANIYNRNKDEFTDTMTCVINTVTQGQERSTRIFSLRGAHLLAMLARTDQAKKFRRFILDMLENEPPAATSLRARNNSLVPVETPARHPRPGDPGYEEEQRMMARTPYYRVQKALMDMEQAAQIVREETGKLLSENNELKERLSHTVKIITGGKA